MGKILVDLGDYRRQVLAFAQQVEDFYNRCSPKVIPEDEFDRNGYLTFWKEWHRRVQAEEEKPRSLSRDKKRLLKPENDRFTMGLGIAGGRRSYLCIRRRTHFLPFPLFFQSSPGKS